MKVILAKQSSDMRKKIFYRITAVICACVFISSFALAQSKTVSGVVSDEAGKPLAGATVSQKGGKAATTTDQGGNFRLEVASSATVLIVSYVGMEIQEIAIAGTDLDLTKKVLFTGTSTPVTAFVSQSATQLVVKVPAQTMKGKITLVPASGVQSVSSGDLDVVLPSITTMSPNPIDTGANLTITGANLNLVTSVSFVGVANPVATFVSQSAAQLIVKVPFGTLKGKLTLGVLNSTLTVQTANDLDINGGLPPLADFPYPIYTDELDNGFQNWSWAANDFNNTSNVRQGTKSILATYNAWDGITFHNDNGPATNSYTKLEFSIFGETGTGGKIMNVVINGAWGSPATVAIMEGELKTYSLDISSLPSPSPWKEIVLQTAGWGGVVHIDHVGLR
jgi:hypothetical protein